MAAKKYISQNGEIQFANASEIYQKELARNQISVSRSECVCVCECHTRWPLPVHYPHLARGFAIPNPKFQSSSNCLAIWPVKWPEGRTGGRTVEHFEYGIEKKKEKLKAISLWKRPYVCNGLITFKEQWRRRSRVCIPIMCECCQGLCLWNILPFTAFRRFSLAFDVVEGSGGLEFKIKNYTYVKCRQLVQILYVSFD